jgi:acetoin utilization protein AcuB
MIADRDLFRHTAPFDKANQIANSELTQVDAFMKNRILTALPSTEIRQIARVMLNEHVGAMPIVTELGELVGIITRTDILRTVTNEVPLELWI